MLVRRVGRTGVHRRAGKSEREAHWYDFADGSGRSGRYGIRA